MLQNDSYETLILVTSGSRHGNESIFAKFKRQNYGETLGCPSFMCFPAVSAAGIRSSSKS